MPVDGRDKPGDPNERLYICPRYWDRKHGISLSPEKLEHPILKIPYDDTDEVKGWRNYIIPHDARTADLKDSDKFIFERLGLHKNKDDPSDGYWYSSGEDVDGYNVVFKQNAHPKYPIPCCGKKPIPGLSAKKKLNKGDNVTVMIDGKQENGIISQKKSNNNYLVKIKGYPKGQDKKIINIARINIKLKTYSYVTEDNFPCNIDDKGMIYSDILSFANIEHNIKETHCGLFRRGIQQDNDSFLRAISSISLKKFKSRLCEDISNLKSFSLIPLYQFFRNDILSCNLEGNNSDKFKNIQLSIIKEAKENLIKYINSDEIKDPFYLIPLIYEITKNKSESFTNIKNLNIIVFEKNENNICVLKPYGGFNLLKTDTFIFVIKNKNNYETIYLKKNKDNLYCPVENKEYIEMCYFNYLTGINKPKINLNVTIKNNNVNGYIENIKDDKLIVNVLDDNSQVTYSLDDFNTELFELHYENSLIDSIMELTKSSNRIKRNYDKTYPDKDKLINIMNELGYSLDNTCYIDIYFRITHLTFVKGQTNFYLPIKPLSVYKETEIYKNSTTIPKVELDKLKELLESIDLKLDEGYLKYSINNKYSKDYLFLEDLNFIPIKDSDKNDSKYNSIIDIPYNIKGSFKENKLKKKIDKYYIDINNENKKNIEYILYLRNNKRKLKDIDKILNNEIMLKIHKREKIKKLIKINNDTDIYKFIEKLIINGYKNLEDILINNSTTKDIMKDSPLVYVFKDFQIKNKDYMYIFDSILSESKFIRNIDKNELYL